MKLSDLNLLDVGNTIQMVGAVYADAETVYFCPFPEDQGHFTDGPRDEFLGFLPKGAVGRFGPDGKDQTLKVRVLDMDVSDWERFIRQTDLMETEIITRASDGTLAKALVRKSQRQIDTAVQWAVFRRDGFRCQYCFGELPLTIDHLVPWKEGGPSVAANLLASCRKCNKTRGDMSFEDWLKHPHYLRVSRDLPEAVRFKNEGLVSTLAAIPRTVHTRSR